MGELCSVRTNEAGLEVGHDYQLYLAINDIEHTKIKARHPQTNGICERFHKTILQEFYQPTFRRKLYGTLAELQNDLDNWLDYYNTNLPIRVSNVVVEHRCKP